jgi:hypothetical protein
MTYLFADTDPRVEAIMLSRLRAMPVWRKLELMEQLNHMAYVLALSDLRERYPQASESELRRRLADLRIGQELAEQAYGPLPEPARGD